MTKAETAGTYGLATVGAIGGAWKYYVKPELTAGRAWAVMGLGILAYELAAPDGQLLSEGVDRGLERHRLLTAIPIGITALHLLNVLPEKIDPYSQFLKHIKKI